MCMFNDVSYERRLGVTSGKITTHNKRYDGSVVVRNDIHYFTLQFPDKCIIIYLFAIIIQKGNTTEPTENNTLMNLC